jgi:AcrR family transcriptional regulator
MTTKSPYHNMAYEVTKTIAGRAYRYRVESIRDPETGKRRNRWTYVGRTDSGQSAPAAPRRRTNAKARLLDALERLLADRDIGAVTADAIASEAGLAHGTFYRYFRNKGDAVRAALDRTREKRVAIAERLRAETATAAEVRAGLREAIESSLRTPAEHPTLLRATYALIMRDAEFAAQHREQRAKGTRTLGEYFAEWTARGIADVAHPEATAGALIAMVDGLYREAMIDGTVLDDDRIAAALEVIDRAVFGASERKNGP